MENQVNEASGSETKAFKSLNQRIDGVDVTDEPGIQTSFYQDKPDDDYTNILPDSNSNENI